MAEQITITLRNKEYPVKKLSGITVIGLIQRLYSQDDLLDPSKMASTAIGLKAVIPDIPDYLISEDTINLQPEEFFEFVDDFREIYFTDNLREVEKLDDYKQQFDYAQGYATFKAYRELRQARRLERQNDWGWKTTKDVRLGIEDAPDDRTWFFFEQYYQQQIKLAQEGKKAEKAKKLKEILEQSKSSFNEYQKSKPTKLETVEVLSKQQELTELENEQLKRKIEQLEKQNKQIAVN